MSSRHIEGKASAGNVDRGRLVEEYAEECGPIALADGDLAADWYDGVITLEAGEDLAGTPIEAKGCRTTVGHTGRTGRIWINRRCHERLLEAGGLYVIGCYDDDDDELQAVEVRTAEAVDDELAGRWTTCGNRHRAEECAQVRFIDVMTSAEVNR